ncbi:relaxase, partial [Escherichia coli]|nr:relaxase [Escherichia coli]HAU9468802.1 relaxase [Escherichia coli]
EAMEEVVSPLAAGDVAEVPVAEVVPVLLQSAAISAESVIQPLPVVQSPVEDAENEGRTAEQEVDEGNETDADTGMLLTLFSAADLSDEGGQIASG